MAAGGHSNSNAVGTPRRTGSNCTQPRSPAPSGDRAPRSPPSAHNVTRGRRGSPGCRDRGSKGRDGDRINAVLAAAGYNFGLLLRWLERLLRALIRALLAAPRSLETA